MRKSKERSPSIALGSVLFCLVCAGCERNAEEGDGQIGTGADDDADVALTDDDPLEPEGTGSEVSEPETVSEPEDDGILFGGGDVDLNVGEPESEPESGDDDGGPSENNPLADCASAIGEGLNLMIDDFEDANEFILEVDNRSAGWYGYDDGTVGVDNALEFESGRFPGEGVYALRIHGGPFDDYSGMGFGLRWTETGDEVCYYDASEYDGIAFWARGSGRVRFTFQTPDIRPVSAGGRCDSEAGCYDAHGHDMELTEQWSYYVMPFLGAEQGGWGLDVGELKRDELFTVEYQFEAGRPYELWLDDVTFYSGDPQIPELPDDVEPEVPEPEVSEPDDFEPDVSEPDASEPDVVESSPGDAGSADAAVIFR